MKLQHQHCVASFLVALTIQVSCGMTSAFAQGPVPMLPPSHAVHVGPHVRTVSVSSVHKHVMHRYPGAVKLTKQLASKKKRNRNAAPPPPPQTYVGDLSVRTIMPGIVHKIHRGAMYINVLDIDLAKANVTVKPVLAGESFHTLEDVKDQAQHANAIAAVNGNYFKRDGTPLGTLMMNGEWIAGPLYDRTSMGITRDGRVFVDRVSLHGTLTTSNDAEPTIWVNNINQPRRHGAHLIAYTRRWGDAVEMQYEGTLVAVDSTGQVCAKDGWRLPIPAGGYVLSDSKESPIAKLNIGDSAALTWQVSPPEWADVVNAVSGGPVLIRDGKLFVDLHDEMFSKAWTGSQIHARTAVGVTANRHVLLATIEGPHTLWDVAKFLKKLGAVDAMNLDGGGSTTMVIQGQAVTHNSSKFERRVASSLVVLPKSSISEVVQYQGSQKVVPHIEPTPTGTDEAAVNSHPVEPAVKPDSTSYVPSPSPQSGPMLPIEPRLVMPQRSLPMVAGNRQHSIPAAADTIAGDTEKTKGSHFGFLKHLNPLR